MDQEAFSKNVGKQEGLKQWLPLLAERLERLEDFVPGPIEAVVRDVATELGIKAGILINGARMLVTGQAAGPGLFEVLAAVGKDRVVQRLRNTPSLFPG